MILSVFTNTREWLNLRELWEEILINYYWENALKANFPSSVDIQVEDIPMPFELVT